MSKSKEPTYQDLSKTLSDEEIAESFILRSTMSTEESMNAREELKKLRIERLKQMSDEAILQNELYRMKVLMKHYFQQLDYVKEFSFGNQLKHYIQLLNISHTQFADDLGVHKTKLSRLINEREAPNLDIMFRLEAHSSQVIPASYWFKLQSRKIEEEIRLDQEQRVIAQKKVKNEVKIKRSA